MHHGGLVNCPRTHHHPAHFSVTAASSWATRSSGAPLTSTAATVATDAANQATKRPLVPALLTARSVRQQAAHRGIAAVEGHVNPLLAKRNRAGCPHHRSHPHPQPPVVLSRERIYFLPLPRMRLHRNWENSCFFPRLWIRYRRRL